MKNVQATKKRRDFWPRTAIVLSIAFLALGIILLVLVNRLLEDSRNHVLQQRLVIAQIVANQIDRTLGTISDELGRTLRLADFDPSDPDLETEARALLDLYDRPGLSVAQVVFYDTRGAALIIHPTDTETIETTRVGPFEAADSLDRWDMFISTPWQDSIDNTLMVAITIPIYKQDHFRGWLSCVVDLEEASIKAMLVDAVTQDQTAHAILVDGMGRALISTFDLPFLSPGEHASFYRRALAQNQAVVEEVLFELDLPNEPPGHHHIMAFVPLRTAPWGVAVGGDVIKETFAAPYQLFLWFTSIIALSLVLIWGATLLGAKRLLDPVRNVNLKFDLSRQIASAKDWNELTSVIVGILFTFLPVLRVRLLLRDQNSRVELVSEQYADDRAITQLKGWQGPDACKACSLVNSSVEGVLVHCSHQVPETLRATFNSYCLSLVHQAYFVGTLQFWLPYRETLSAKQMDVLNSVSSEIAMALESAQSQHSNLTAAEITQAEQKRIFRKLHDTLGQNISFLRLKLDQHSTMSNSVSIAEFQQDIMRMREIADEAYEHIRSMLTDLNPETQSDLVAALRSRAGTVSERAHFDFTMTISGQTAKVPQRIKRHVLFICYEALNNIEQHANARNVSMHLLWSDSSLTITIADDGDGFNLKSIPSEEHFGLAIMQERALTIKAKLTVSSEFAKGTEVTLWIPL